MRERKLHVDLVLGTAHDQSTMEGLQRARELRRNMRPHDQLGRNALRAVVFARKHESVDTRSADKA